jgi:hypothetical protein
MAIKEREGLTRLEWKNLKKKRIKEFMEKTVYELEDLEIDAEEINGSQWRLYIGSETVDIYPKGQKYCHLNLKHWGKYTDLFDLVNSFKY